MQTFKYRKFKLLPLAATIMSLTSVCSFAQDVKSLSDFDIPKQSLASALLIYSEQSGVQISVDAESVEGMSSRAVSGQRVSIDALNELLMNSGLTYSVVDDNTVVVIKQSEKSAGKELLASNQVSQKRMSENSPAEISGSASDDEGNASSNIAKQEQRVEKISVVGSKIANSRIDAALPVAVFDQEALSATGVVDGNELVRSMPQMGDITWNESWIPGSSNAARGDTGSLNLKNLGASNTLLLINGRRSVIHPTTSTVDDSMSTTTFNTNAIPMYGLDRVEVLLDGAAAIYGSDAIAGVVNVVTRNNINGAGIKFKFGAAEGTGRSDTELTGYWGSDINDGKGNISVMYNYSHREPQRTSDQWYTATSDRSNFLTGTDLYGAASLDGRSSYSPWGSFVAPFAVTQNGQQITSAAGYFHSELADSANCASEAVDSICYAQGSTTTEYKYDAAKDNTYLTPKVDRFNIFSNFLYQITPDLEFIGELALYKAKSKYVTGPGAFSVNTPVYIPADAYYNPFGATYLADGSLNPNRLDNLDNVPDEGVPLELRYYRFADAGNRDVDVDNMQTRILAGLKGWTANDFEWESAFLYSQGYAKDRSESYSVNKIVEAMSLTTADAYNPFNGGSYSHITYGDEPTNSQSTIDSFTTWSVRESTSELASWDFKINKSDIFELPAGSVGFAAGVEVRYESLKDDRDPLVDGSSPYVDWYTGTTYDSDLAGSSPTPDSYGSRNVKTAYAEFALPLVSEEMHIPLVQTLDMQLAGRFESYNDVGDISTPKVALAWGVMDSLMLRGSWSEGFKAPNLEVLNATEMARYQTFLDYSFCEGDVQNGNIANYSECTQYFAVTRHTQGNENLTPETSTNQSVGFVYTPELADGLGNIRFTMDAWTIQIDDQVGIEGTANIIIHDAYLRVTQGTADSRVFRYEPNADQVAFFAGTGLEPIGEIQYVQTDYANLNSIEAKGLDFNFDWSIGNTQYGDFSFNMAVSKLISFKQELSAEMQAAQQAQQAGLLDQYISIGTSDEVGVDGKKPEWKASSRLIWNMDNYTYRISAQYTGSVIDGNYASGADFKVEPVTTINTSFQYNFDESSSYNGLSAEIGVRNLFDKEPPLNASGQYLANLYLPYSRYLYASLEMKF
ncbi:TonB-dependent receptor domain-containing protein [Paraglaciecola sp. 2405UD69-4]|uniref:TonB-dependent receptor domain-containing protein n=1 Tax=Paraglaciecola sp. 2405UD69-4 TaxID=3391836 RepID=UPI0039C9817C